MTILKETSALVVHSGGADSTICLHWALDQFKKVEAITFNYGQRHVIELEAAQKICELNNIPQKVVHINSFTDLGSNALTDNSVDIEFQKDKDLPNTFVPGRNLIFLTMAAAWAYQRGIQHLVTGVCQTDFSGYPDCRNETIQSLSKTISLGIDKPYTIHTPLMFIDKAESVRLASSLGAFESLSYSHTCYEGQIPPCGKCPSCELRQKGFDEAGFKDPLLERLQD